jgi:DNA polymerase
MGFFFSDLNTDKKITKSSIVAEKFGCSLCTLNKLKNNNPNMKPTGTNTPIIYMLGEAPGATEDTENEQFIGESGQILRKALIEVADLYFINHHIRWNNVVRCRPFIGNSNRTPTQLEIDCCRRSLVEDIEKTKPVVIVGFGEIPLKALTSGKHIGMWRGRFVPIKVGNHVCWYFPSYHPGSLIRKENKMFESEYDKCFKMDLKNVINFVFNEYEDPIFINSDFEKGIELILDNSKTSLQHIKERLIEFSKDEYSAIDIETFPLKPYYPDSILVSIAIGNDEDVIVFPIDYPDFWSEEDLKELYQILYEFLSSNSSKIAHTLKFELEWLYSKYKSQEFIRQGKWEDTMLQAYMLDERTSKEEGMLTLDSLTAVNFGFNLKEKTDVNRKNILKSRLKDILLYNGMDTKYTYKLFFAQKRKLANTILQKNYEKTIETTRTLVFVQNYGINIDKKELAYYNKFFTEQIQACENKIYNLPEVKEFEKMVHRKLDILSNDDLVIIFKDILKYKEVKKTKKAQKFALDDEVMKTYAEIYNSELAKAISDYRTFNKAKSTYIDNITNNLIGDLVHPNFNIIGTKTGRFSSGKNTN